MYGHQYFQWKELHGVTEHNPQLAPTSEVQMGLDGWTQPGMPMHTDASDSPGRSRDMHILLRHVPQAQRRRWQAAGHLRRPGRLHSRHAACVRRQSHTAVLAHDGAQQPRPRLPRSQSAHLWPARLQARHPCAPLASRMWLARPSCSTNLAVASWTPDWLEHIYPQ